MARNSLDQVASNLKDPLQPWNFGLLIPNIPGGGNGLSLSLRCQSTVIPGIQMEPALVELRGMQLQFAGRPLYSHNLPVTYLEARDIESRRALMNWFYFCRDFRNNTGNYKQDYATLADMELYDDVGKIVRTIRLYGVFPLDLQDAQTESTGSQPVALSGNFSYDYFRDLEAL